LYVIVDFPDVDITEEDKFFPDLPCTCITVEPVTLRCEKKCCSVTTVPLHICKAITIHKAQGISIGPGHVWERVVIALPEATDHKMPALELALSRAMEPMAFAISCDAEITRESLLNMGHGKAYDQRHDFKAKLHELAAESQVSLHVEIIAEDPNWASPTLEVASMPSFAAFVSLSPAQHNLQRNSCNLSYVDHALPLCPFREHGIPPKFYAQHTGPWSQLVE
jgi:hypothetical protein